MNQLKETENIELKESVSQTSRAIESIAAILNKNGHAIVYFGINDKGAPKKFDFSNKTITKLSNEITTNIIPKITPTISTEIIDGIPVIKVEVYGNDQPYSAFDKYLIRSGAQNKKLSPNELKNLVINYAPNLITEIPSLNQQPSFNTLKHFYTLAGVKYNEKTFIKNNHFLTTKGEINLLADLLSDNNEISIKVVRFDGHDKSKVMFREEFGGKCLLQAITDVINYVRALNKTKILISGKSQRQENKLFEESCFREAWMNACVHNRWCDRIPPAVYIYDDRIEIVSYGGLPITLNHEEFFNGISRPVNKQLQFILGQVKFVEQTGHGVPDIVSNYGSSAFQIFDNNIIVTLKFNFELEKSIAEEHEIKLDTPKEQAVYDLIKLNANITTSEISKTLKTSTSWTAMTLKKLKDKHIIERCGSRKTGTWKTINKKEI